MQIDWGKTVTSKTLWLQVLAIALIAAQYAQGQPWIDPGLQVLILAVLNAINRFLTNDAIAGKKNGSGQ